MNTRDFRVYLMLLISPFVLALGERASAQVEVIPPKEFDLPRFYVDALNFASVVLPTADLISTSRCRTMSCVS